MSNSNIQNEIFILLGIVLIGVIIGVAVYYGLRSKKDKHHKHHRKVGGCGGTRWGCCPDGDTPKYDSRGSNCVPKPGHHHRVGGCNGTRWGCCPNGVTPARGPHHRGC